MEPGPRQDPRREPGVAVHHRAVDGERRVDGDGVRRPQRRVAVRGVARPGRGGRGLRDALGLVDHAGRHRQDQGLRAQHRPHPRRLLDVRGSRQRG